jgi:periplasmic divalent cation tolerance protein
MADEVLLAISTFPDAETATRIGRQLVNDKLAACANIGAPVQSIYRWQGKIEESQETMVFFKTTAAQFDALQAALRTLHPYEVPELVALPVTNGLPDYLRWVVDSCDA